MRARAGSSRRCSLCQMREAEPVAALHLLEARGGPLEHLRALALLIKLVGLRLGGGDQLHPVLVESIDQGDETARRVELRGRQAWNPVQDQRMVVGGDRDIVS